MKFAALALASTFALAIGSAQPVLAQTQNQNGLGNQPYAQGQSELGNNSNNGFNGNNGLNNGSNATNGYGGDNATNGFNADEQNGNWNESDNDNDNGQGGWNNWRHHHGWHQGRMGMGAGGPMMWHRHEMMMRNAMGGAHFRFARGKARIDIRCPAQGNLQACVHAATQLLDKIAELHNGGGKNTSGSANDSSSTNGSAIGQQPGSQSGATPGSTSPGTTNPQTHGEHM